MSGLVIGQCYAVQVTHPQQTVLIALADHAEDDGSAVFPSIAYVAWKTGYSDRQITRLIGDLVRLGILVLVKKAYRGRPNEYRIDLSNAPMKPKFRVDAADEKDAIQMSPQMPSVSPQLKEVTGDISGLTGDISNHWGDKSDSTDDTQMSPRTVLGTINLEPSLKPSGVPVAIASRRPSAKKDNEKLSADGRPQSEAARELRQAVRAEHPGLTKGQIFQLNDAANALVLEHDVADILGCWRAIKAKHGGDYKPVTWTSNSIRSWIRAGRPDVEPASYGANNVRTTNGIHQVSPSGTGRDKYDLDEEVETAFRESSRSQQRPIPA